MRKSRGCTSVFLIFPEPWISLLSEGFSLMSNKSLYREKDTTGAQVGKHGMESASVSVRGGAAGPPPLHVAIFHVEAFSPDVFFTISVNAERRQASESISTVKAHFKNLFTRLVNVYFHTTLHEMLCSTFLSISICFRGGRLCSERVHCPGARAKIDGKFRVHVGTLRCVA